MNFTITLPSEQMQVVLQAVEAGPYRLVAPIVQSILAQIAQQAPVPPHVVKDDVA